MPEHILADTHVHYYASFDRRQFFDSAFRNFQAGARALGLHGDATYVLLMSETASDHFFREFRSETRLGAQERWTFRATDEDHSLIACRDGEERIIIIAGRQVATREGLEVLALGCAREFADGQSLSRSLEEILETGAIAVLPWGFGKWWFGRGALMARVVASLDPDRVFLGDNGGRPRLSRPPRLFEAAKQRGIRILAGSDPLPMSSQAGKAGSYGSTLEGTVDRSRPAENLKQLLRSRATRPRTYGRLERFVPFCRNQLLMQVRKFG